ncbi:hypothetical protein ACPPVQ_05515 [Diaminobutyricibacter sp. McL0618]|uniref:hypothetical protein n=1 Tax=Leifsonia sp. McL0618 TaxID=3415677 RepID=UPI003CEEDFD1
MAAGGKAHSANFNGVVCPSGGDCVAYGSDVAADGHARPLLVTRHVGSWTPLALPFPEGAKPSTDSYSEVRAVSCLQSKCLAVAVYVDAQQVLHFFSNTLAREGGSTIELPLVGAAKSADDLATEIGQAQGNVSLSCWSTTACMAAISIRFDFGGSFQHDAFELVRFDGQRWTTLTNPVINLPATKYGTEVDDLSCSTRGWCAMTGEASDSMGTSLRAWTAVPRGTEWRASVQPNLQAYRGLSCGSAAHCHALALTATGNALVTLAADGSTIVDVLPRDFTAYDMGCSPLLCAFAGSSDNNGGYLGTQSEAARSTTGADPNGAHLQLGNPGTVACTSSSYCVAVGGFEVNSLTGASEPLVETFTNSSWKATTPAAPSKGGTLNGVACESASNCVATGQANGTVRP